MALVGCATQGPTLGPLTDIRVLGENARGTDRSACESFAFSDDDARHFFDRAVVVTPYETNYGYEIFGCTARGTAVVRGQAVTWEVDRGGTGTVMFSKEFTFAVADPWRRAMLE